MNTRFKVSIHAHGNHVHLNLSKVKSNSTIHSAHVHSNHKTATLHHSDKALALQPPKPSIKNPNPARSRNPFFYKGGKKWWAHRFRDEAKRVKNKYFHSHDHHHDHDHDHHHHHDHHHGLSRDQEGCPCCATAVDLDEIATAIHEATANSSAESGAHSADFFGDGALSNVDVNFGIFLGISGPLALLGLTAALRNVNGTFNNIEKLETIINGLNKDIQRYKNLRDDKDKESSDFRDLSGVIQRLEAFRETLSYSHFDSKFNFYVPGILNGSASVAVLSNAISTSPVALPIIALYAGCQAARNGYDTWRIWNKILPENLRQEVQIQTKVGNKKINQITKSKRRFYSANTFGFTSFSVGASVTAAGVLTGNPPLMFGGIGALAFGAVSTAITNNWWTNKFKPRNSDLGIPREQLHLGNIPAEIGARRQLKKAVKNFSQLNIPNRYSKRFGWSLFAALPSIPRPKKKFPFIRFGKNYAADRKHRVNKKRVKDSRANISEVHDLLTRMIMIRDIKNKDNSDDNFDLINGLSDFKSYPSINRLPLQFYEKIIKLGYDNKSNVNIKSILDLCDKLEILPKVVEKLIDNEVLQSSSLHDTSIKSKFDFFRLINSRSGLFTVYKANQEIGLNIDNISKNQTLVNSCLNAIQEFLVLDHVETLRYEQYGLYDFYWSLNKQNKIGSKKALADNNIDSDSMLDDSTLAAITDYAATSTDRDDIRSYELIKKSKLLASPPKARVKKISIDIDTRDALIYLAQKIISDEARPTNKETVLKSCTKSKLFQLNDDKSQIRYKFSLQHDVNDKSLLTPLFGSTGECVANCNHPRHEARDPSRDDSNTIRTSKRDHLVSSVVSQIAKHYRVTKSTSEKLERAIKNNIFAQTAPAPKMAYNGCGIKGSFARTDDGSMIVIIDDIFDKDRPRFFDINGTSIDHKTLINQYITHVKIDGEYKELKDIEIDDIIKVFRGKGNSKFIINGKYEIHCNSKEVYVTDSCPNLKTINSLKQKNVTGEIYNPANHGFEPVISESDISKIIHSPSSSLKTTSHRHTSSSSRYMAHQ